MELDVESCGFSGSPTKVHAIKNITLTGGDLEFYGSDEKSVKSLVRNIMKDYVEV